MNLTNLQTDPEVSALLERARNAPPPTAHELFEQRVSFIAGQMRDGDKENIRRVLRFNGYGPA